MTLTIEEKEHWKERISRKIDLAIETLCDEHDPNILVRVGWRADRLALESLDIVETHTRLHEIKVAKEALDREENTLLRKLGESYDPGLSFARFVRTTERNREHDPNSSKTP